MSIAARSLHGIGVCVIPSPHNDDRPLVLRHKSLAFISTFLVMVKLAALGVVALTPAQAELSTITVDRIVQLTNSERVNVGLSPLTVNNKLATAARNKGNHMLAEDYFAHISPSGVTPWFWMAKENYTYQIAGENLAIDFTEAEDVVAAWIASPSHKANMLHTEYTETGVAVVTGEFQGGTSTIVVHMFGKPSGARVVAEVVSSTPTPSPSPSPTPSPAVPSAPRPDSAPPRVPRIVLTSPTATVGTTLSLSLEGEPLSQAHLVVNGQEHATIDLDGSGAATETIDLASIPDGTLVLGVYATDSAGNKSEVSAPITATKDTQGPPIARQELAYLISPAFDIGRAAALLPAGDFARITLVQAGEQVELTPGAPAPLVDIGSVSLTFTDERGNTTTLSDIALAPQFAADERPGELQTPSNLSRLARRLTATTAVTILALLIIAIVVRIRVQRPDLIAHASVVILLAAALFVF